MIYNFTINDVPPSSNITERASYKERAKLRNKWESHFKQAMHAHRIPCAAGKRKVTYTIWFAYQGSRDPQNYLCKGFIDAMVRSGLIVNDNPTWVELSLPKIGLEIGNGHTDFTIEDLNGPDV